MGGHFFVGAARTASHGIWLVVSRRCRYKAFLFLNVILYLVVGIQWGHIVK